MATVTPLTLEMALEQLHALADPAVLASQVHFASHPAQALGVRIPQLRALAKGQRDHALAQQLWQTGLHEARILASMVDDCKQVTPAQMEQWVADFDAWDLCDQVCINLFDRTPWAVEKAIAWSERPEEFVRRAGFVLMAGMAIHRRELGDEVFMPFFPLMVKQANDSRNFVRKAVNWALRGIGKRNENLRRAAIVTARQIAELGSPTAKWIAADALRELQKGA